MKEVDEQLISLNEIIEIMNKYIKPKNAVYSEIFRSKEQYFEQQKEANDTCGIYEKVLGEICWRSPKKQMYIPGYCEVCEKKMNFNIDYMFADLTGGEEKMIPVWRERLVCNQCKLNNRMRFFVGMLKNEFKEGKKIYIYEQITQAYKELKKTIPDIVGSEYLGEGIEGGTIINGIRHEDAMLLSFKDETFDIAASQDVFEHVADFKVAYKEMYRILKKGGKAIFTVPFAIFEDKTQNRAIVENGKIKYLMEPMYHGNPLSDKGALVFNIFSWDLFGILKECGFQDAYGCTYYNIDKGNLGILPFYIVAVK